MAKAKIAKEAVEALVRMADDPAVPKKLSYRGGHTAPISPEYHAPMHDITKTYPDDIYGPQGARFYGHGDPELDAPTFEVINRVRGDENAPVTIYRAVPSNVENEILPGDWVTPNEMYARQHGEGLGDYKILKGETNAGRLRTDGNSPHEFGYTGNASPELLAGIAVGTGVAVSQAAQDAEQLRSAHADFAAKRESKRGFWESRKRDVLELANGVGGFAENVAFPAMDKPMQGIYGMTGAMAALARGQGWDNAIQQGAMYAQQPVEQTAYNMGGAVSDALSPYLPAPVAAGAGTAVNIAGQVVSPF
jgi:hypothetical protein